MSRPTPRKARHRHNPSGSGPRIAAASDYESDAAQYYLEERGMESFPQIPERTNTELNLTVLQRYLSDIQSIMSIAANAVVYTFSPETQNWDKSGVEGTLFVCEREAVMSGNKAIPRACVFVLNRKGLDNVIVDLANVSDCEFAAELLILRLREEDGSQGGQGAPRVLGIWIHADKDDTQEVNTAIIQEYFRQIQLALGEASSEGVHDLQSSTASLRPQQEEFLGPAMQAMGRRVSLSDLFGQRAGEVSEGGA
ncbi:uncharacterized protein E0L32_006721 [Thyridium curvatum]|uniref:Uncharacterized protein n=1 Tax=Thyridium curvatum TaxID=1093900 RepID=A0A507B709_9PEZI|nr:uncharacterized protein E0L32_006721 [Thyridium curvatum]TPX12841.1 hypothetical protein E0L32_006721 [Thyridium curvatum]